MVIIWPWNGFNIITDSDSEDGFDSDEAVGGSSDSEEEDSEEEDDEDDEEEDVEKIDISELKRANPMSNIEEPGKDRC